MSRASHQFLAPIPADAYKSRGRKHALTLPNFTVPAELIMSNTIPSGNWSGFYLEAHRPRKGWMHLHLLFENGQMKGEGTDYVGPWTLEGNYHAHDTVNQGAVHCRWIKTYVGRHRVIYEGNYGQEGIVGQWRIPNTNTGNFQIWPETFGELNEKFLKEELENQLPPAQLLGRVEDDPFLL